jgi:hemoglobin
MDVDTSVSEDTITHLVDRFYDRVRADDRLGPLFNSAIANWDEHLQIMRDFWSAVLLRTGRYQGCVMSPHFRMGLAADDFDRWLVLFEAAVAETLPHDAAEHAMAVAHGVSDRLRRAFANMRAATGSAAAPGPA